MTIFFFFVVVLKQKCRMQMAVLRPFRAEPNNKNTNLVRYSTPNKRREERRE